MTGTESSSQLDVRQVEAFLYAEAALLDEWRLDEWLTLFAEDARYVVPTTDLPSGDPQRDLVLIVDDMRRLRGRVARLNNRLAHREFPHSRTRRLVTNVRVISACAEAIEVEANFVVYRFRSREGDPYVGRYRYVLRPYHDSFRILERRAELDHETLDAHGTVSIIL